MVFWARAGFELTTPALRVRTLNRYTTVPLRLDGSLRTKRTEYGNNALIVCMIVGADRFYSAMVHLIIFAYGRKLCMIVGVDRLLLCNGPPHNLCIWKEIVYDSWDRLIFTLQ